MALIFIVEKSCGQFIIPGEGLMDVKIGSDWDEIEWELGFKGKKIRKSDVSSSLLHLSKTANVEFDFVVSYRHLMWLPVSELYFKNDRVCMIRIDSSPDYYKMLCVDIGTVEGLNFWDKTERVKEIYGSRKFSKHDGKSFVAFSNIGLGVELSEDEVRSMVIFQPQIE